MLKIRQVYANAAANKLRELIDNGKAFEVEKSKPKARLMTFSEVAGLLTEKWKERLSQGDLSRKTYEEYDIGINVLTRFFDRQLITEITKDDILAYRNGLAEEHSNVYSNRQLFLIKQVFQYGQEINAGTNNPVVGIKYLSEKKHERNTFLKPDELNHFLQVIKTTPGRWFHLPALVLLGAEHGASKQECLSLKWEDIDFDFDGKGLIRFFRTKNRHERTEFLMPRTKEALLEWKNHVDYMRHRKRIHPYQDDYVFCRLDGRPLERFDCAWREARKIGRIPQTPFSRLKAHLLL